MSILAYIDPGAGTLIWQSIIAMFVGFFFYLKKTRQWVGRIIGKVIGPGQKSGNHGVALQPSRSKVEADHL
jgi:hypothetical protein